MANKLEVSDIADSIKGRISELEKKLKDHQSMRDELERLQGALSRLEGVMHPRATAGRRAQRPATQRKRAAARKETAATKSTTARAPRGQNKAKILESLKDGPKTASQIAKDAPEIGIGTISSTLGKLAKDGAVVKADRGYALPK
jgi:biopolymer transport protein ExbB/TolQ